MKLSRIKPMMFVMLVGVSHLGVIVAGPIMSNVEKPDYQVLSKANNIEIRQYSAMLTAEVSVSGDRIIAIKEGVQLLADYIFGNNRVNKKIAMTAPVQQQANGDSWQVSFIMPSEYTIESIPKPVNDKIQLKEVPAKQYITIRFSGLNSQKNIEEHEKDLVAYVNANQMAVTGSPIYAFYNPPWSLPPMRRNEIMLQLDQLFQKNNRGKT